MNKILISMRIVHEIQQCENKNTTMMTLDKLKTIQIKINKPILNSNYIK